MKNPAPSRNATMLQSLRLSMRRLLVLTVIVTAPAMGSEFAEDVLDALIVPDQPHRSVALSPDGMRMAYGQTVDGRLVVSVLDLATNDTSSIDVTSDDKNDPRRVMRIFRRESRAFKGWWGIIRSGGADPGEFFIDYVEWPTNDRIIFRVSDGELFGVDPEGANRVKFLQIDTVQGVPAHSLDTISYADGINLLPEDSEHIMVAGGTAQLGVNPATLGGQLLDSYFGVNIRDGRTFEVANADRMDGAVLVDQFGVVRGSHRSAFRQKWSQIRLHDGKKQSFQPLDAIFGNEKLEAYGLRVREFSDRWVGGVPLGFGFSPDILFFAAPHERDTNAVFAANIKNREIVGPVFSADGFDVASPFYLSDDDCLIFVPERKEVGGFRYEDVTERTVWRLPDLGRVQGTVDKSLPDRVNRIFDWDQSLQKFLVHSYTASDPGAVFLVDLAARQLKRLVELLPGLDRSRLGSTAPIWADMRDGRQILCYLTLPPGDTAAPPLVVLLDNAGWERATYSFSEAVQYFAANGYAVLQVNHRGLPGFGLSHLNAARGNYIEVAAADVEDAVAWVAGRGLIDPQRVFGAGRSIGGTLALSIAADRPELFRAVVCVDAYTDPAAIVSSELDHFFDWMAADPDKSTSVDSRRNSNALRRMSPYPRAGSITAPVFFFAFTSNEATGPAETALEARKMHAALKSKGIESEIWVVDEERVNTREELKAPVLAMMAFIHRHDPGRAAQGTP